MVGQGLSQGQVQRWWDQLVSALVLTVVRVHDLEVLDGGLRDSALEVEGVGASGFVPEWWLVVQLNEALQSLVLPAHQQPIAGLGGRKVLGEDG